MNLCNAPTAAVENNTNIWNSQNSITLKSLVIQTCLFLVYLPNKIKNSKAHQENLFYWSKCNKSHHEFGEAEIEGFVTFLCSEHK